MTVIHAIIRPKKTTQKHLEAEGGGLMASKQYTPYNSFYKPKDKTMMLPEFWYYALASQKKDRIPYSTFYRRHK